MRYLLKRGVDINYQNSNGVTALLSACHWGYYKIAEFLLQNGADPNIGSQINDFSLNPLLSAAFKGYINIVNLLIVYDANPKITQMYNKKTTGFKLKDKQISDLYSAYFIYRLSRQRKYQQMGGRSTILANCSENIFNQLCMMI